MSSLSSEVRQAIRNWLKSPATALMALGTIACGTAALTAVLALVNAVLLRPLPYPDPDRLVVLVNTFGGQPLRSPYVSAPRIRVWGEIAGHGDVVALYTLGSAVNVTRSGRPLHVSSAHVNAHFFAVFGARAARGRVFTPTEDRPGHELAAVISHAWWQQLGGGEAIVGATISVNGEPATVVGVLDEHFDARSLAPGIVTPPDIWLPLRQEPATRDDANNLFGVARLERGTSIEAARRHARTAADAFRAAFPGEMPADASFDVRPLADVVVGDVRPSLVMLLAAVGLVAMLVSANTANLLLALAAGRRRDRAVRLALGASRWRLVRQALVEGSVLSAVGGVAGSALGMGAIRLLVQLDFVRVPRIAELGMADVRDPLTLLLSVAAVLAIGIAVGLAPAFDVARAGDCADLDLRAGPRVSSGRRQRRMQTLLVAGEMAIACVVLIAATLLLRSFAELQRVDLGFNRSAVLTMQTASGDRRLATSANALPVLQGGLDRLTGVHGVESATVSLMGVPLAQGGALRADIVGRPTNEQYVAFWDLVSPGYFDVFGVRLIRGRVFDERDGRGRPPVVVINATMARQLWPDRTALGQRIVIGQGGGPAFDEGVPREVVGVVTDVRQSGTGRSPRAGMYVPLAQMPDGPVAFMNRLSLPITWAIRLAPGAAVSPASLQQALLDSTALPPARVQTMDEVFGAATASAAQNSWLMAVLAALASMVAVMGVHAIASLSVQQRTHELGVRLALGAQASALRRMVVWDSARIVLAGTAIGVGVAAGLSTLLATLLFGVAAHDPLTMTLVPGTLIAAAIAGAYLPARRASTVDPLRVLRE